MSNKRQVNKIIVIYIQWNTTETQQNMVYRILFELEKCHAKILNEKGTKDSR